MKELSIEEKAKAYDEALKVLHKYDGVNIMFSQTLKEEMFPELKKSDDEKIKKAIIALLNATVKGKKVCSIADTTRIEMVAWLEKQGEQKPAWSGEDKVMLDEIIEEIEVLKEEESNKDVKAAYQREINWLKSLKERVLPRSKQQWCEEDEKINYALMNLVERQTNYPTKWYSWLKSLKYRIQPQEKQE